MKRLGPISPEQLTPEAKREWDILARIRSPKGGMFGGPYDPWLRSPELCHRLQGLGGFLWERTSLERGLVEYIIALASRHWQTNVEWEYHRQRAVEYQVPPSELDRLVDNEPPLDRRRALAFDVAQGLLQNRSIGETLYAKAKEEFGEAGLAELAALVGYYSLVSFTLRLFEIESDATTRSFDRPLEWTGTRDD